MNNFPLISVIIPCYNAEKTLDKCLKSVVQQLFTNLEIIIVDDGSTDGTLKICEEFQNKDERIQIITQSNYGVSKARNEGIKVATGKYVCFVDSDDWVEPTYCSELLNLLVTENADISIIEASYEDESGRVIFKKPTSKENILEGNRALILLLQDHVIQSHPWGKLYKTKYLKSISFPENLKCFEDYSTLFKIFDKAEKVVRSDEKLYHYIQLKDSLSHDLSPKMAYYFYLAIMEVFNFWQSKNDLKNQGKVIKNIIKKLLMSLKRIIRNTTKEEMQTEKEEIRQFFQSFHQYSVENIGVEYWFYLRLYYYYPNLYSKLISKK